MTKLLLSAGLMALATGAAAQDRQLQLYNWGDYTSPEMIEKFEAETGIDVTITDYDSNDTALAKVQAGGHGFDLVVPSANYVQIWVELGLIQPLDHAKLTNIGNIAPEWVDVPWDPGRAHTIPWQWGTTGMAVNTSVYAGDINTSDIVFNPPAELQGKINVVPEMADVMALAIMNVGGEPCTDDLEVLREVRDLLVAAKPNWLSMDYDSEAKLSANDISAALTWNGPSMRARLANPPVQFGYPVEGYPVWMDSVALLSDAQNVEEAYEFMNFILAPENAAMISNYARYGNGIAGAEEFMDEEMQSAPEIVVPEEHRANGVFLPTCPAPVTELYSQIWTELQS
ncbi:MAG: Spermidine/putrescine import ABC transporter substrate-binding protein PotD [uncultured Rubellimicrobium sp.]|uniref:Putrescine-binding periplasmic protein n=1 Tax=uncultured Rubellimicrobium sp. TaxID=543078 RepID=A0A6J4Q3D7_9RHOB|nr:MAG: Spermidine/putrescine import ABC transporter substrate-binding protein PotD [uncultured Rubellimicrobium sp.]